jgi:hypothetical protein
MRGAVVEQNYWPGYLDALINVMLNLLFLVAVFAIGLLLLNSQSISQQRQLEQMGSDRMQLFEELGLTEAEKEMLSERLDKLDVNAMVERRRLLDLSSKEAAKKELTVSDNKKQSESAASAATETKPELVDTRQALLNRLKEKNAKLAELDKGLKELNDRLAQSRRQQPAAQASFVQPVQALVPPQAQAELRQIVDFRLTGRGQALSSLETLNALKQTLGTEPQAVWEFGAEEFAWSVRKGWPEGYTSANKSQAWKLVVFADFDNQRILRESFARGQATREWMVQDGHARGQIQLELKPTKQIPGLDEVAFRHVFMVPRP